MPADAGHIPEATVNRLPLYLRVLGDVAEEQDTISSEELAHLAGVQAAQVRKDLSHLGSYGTRGVGYDVAYLMRQVNRRFGLDTRRRAAIVGAGHLGQALASYGGFAARGFDIVAVFDSDPAKVGTPVGPTVVAPFSDLDRVAAETGVEVGIVTVPAGAAQSVVDALVRVGVESVLNFAPVSVTVPPNVSIRHVDLGIELQILIISGQAGRSEAAAPEAVQSAAAQSVQTDVVPAGGRGL